eukprot:gene18105-21564_t
MVDRRFSCGDLIKLGNDKDFYVDHVGLLATRGRLFSGARYEVHIPNSTIVKANITNESCFKERRLSPTIHVDPTTPAAKLKQLPIALSTAVKEATTAFTGVKYIQKENGVCCELRDMQDPMGLRFELSVMIQHDKSDSQKWKRYMTSANIAMLECLQARGIRMGCPRQQHEGLTSTSLGSSLSSAFDNPLTASGAWGFGE